MYLVILLYVLIAAGVISPEKIRMLICTAPTLRGQSCFLPPWENRAKFLVSYVTFISFFSNICKWYPLPLSLHPEPFKRWVVPLFVNTPARLPKHPLDPPNPVTKSTAKDIPTSATFPIHPNPAAKYSHLCLFLQFLAPKGLLAVLGLSSLLT